MKFNKSVIYILTCFLLLACSCSKNQQKIKIGPVDSSKLKDGTYQGTYFKFPNRAAVDVTVNDGRITAINITSHFEGMGDKAEDPTIARIIKNQSTRVDAVTGATSSSYTVMCAVQDALNKSYKMSK